MIQTLVASTVEIDDLELAVEEILAQIPLTSLRAHSVGILSCHYDFIQSGAMKAVCAALPFPVAGAVSMSQVTPQALGTFVLSIFVLTSDEADFTIRRSSPFADAPCDAVSNMYREAAAIKDAAPSFAFTFLPFTTAFPADVFVDTISALSGGLPCFGAVALDDTPLYTNSFICVNGEAYTDCAAIVLVYSERVPQFLLATISREKVLPNPALVTKSEGNILMEVNGHHVAKHFESLGLEDSTGQYAMSALPFLMDFNDGTPPVSRVFTAHTPENYNICAGFIPEGSLMYMGVFDKEDVLHTTSKAVKNALTQATNGILMYSCLARSMALGADGQAELSLVQSLIGTQAPYLMAYNGGEICPTQINDTKAINRLHNNTFTICLL